MRAFLLGVAMVVAGCAVEDPGVDQTPAQCEGGKCDGPDSDGHLHATTIAAGWDHSCAILPNGNVRCWGSNGFGESGSHDQERADGSWGPLKVAKFPGPMRAVAGNDSASCGYVVSSHPLPSILTAPDDGTVEPATGATYSGVYCWGLHQGLPVLDTTLASPAPQLLQIPGMDYGAGISSPLARPALTAMTMGLDSVCVANGAGVSCSGIIGGQLQSKTYASLSTLTNHEVCEGSSCVSQLEPEIEIVELVTGTAETCARSEDGRAWCWDPTSATSEPTQVTAAAVTHIAAGDRYSCIATAEATYCKGSNAYGTLGNGSDVFSSDTFVRVSLPAAASALAASDGQACAIVGDDVYCWGLDETTGVVRKTPVRVEGLTGAAKGLTLGNDFACITSVAGVQCWGGDNSYGQLGTHNGTERGVPRFVPAQPGTN